MKTTMGSRIEARTRLHNNTTYDTEEQISSCLRCPYAECINCLAGGSRGEQGRPSKLTDEIKSAIETNHLTASQVTKQFGLSPKTARKYVRTLINY